MEHRSRYWGSGEGCFGVVWIESSGECWLRNSTVSTASLAPKEGHYSALIESGDMTPYPTECPNEDTSVKSLAGVDGLQYTTHCGKVIRDFDTCFSGYPKPCLSNPYLGFFHTSSLEACLQICVDQHPLCHGVSWNPGLQIGFASCWPKTGFPETLDDPTTKTSVMHSATITQIDPVNRTCPSTKQYTASNTNISFDLHCGQLNAGTNITSLHTQNVTSCMDACATSTQKCVGIVFDSQLGGGFKNWYLQNTTSVISDQASATYAVLANSVLPSSSSAASDSSSTNNTGSSSSKAWIAGPVIGGLIILGTIGFSWRRRRAAASRNAEKVPDTHPGYDAAPAYSPGVDHEQAHGYYDAPTSEMEARQTTELPASTKYAHASGPRAQAQEMP